MTLPDFVAGLLRWLGSAIELKSLVDAAAVILEISHSKTAVLSENDAEVLVTPVYRPSTP